MMPTLGWKNTCRRVYLLVRVMLIATISYSSFAADTTRVSVDSFGAEVLGESISTNISASGRFVVFSSLAGNLVPNDSNETYDVFLHDRETGVTERVSVDSAGIQGNGYSGAPRITPDGRFVVFDSGASNLVPNDTGDHVDVYVHDRLNGETSRVSDNGPLQPSPEGQSYVPDISDDGRFVVFNSEVPNLVLGDTNEVYDVFVHDRLAGVTERVSVDSNSVEGNELSTGASISADGRFVIFYSMASNLVTGDNNGSYDVFVHDRTTGQTERVSVDSSGQEGNLSSYRPALSADGRYAVFESEATNFIADDNNESNDVFVHDRQTGQTRLISMDNSGIQGSGSSGWSRISGDGRYVVFESVASNLVENDGNGARDIFIRDRVAGFTERVSVTHNGVEASSLSFLSSVSNDGQYVVFLSDANNLVPGDNNGVIDTFVRNRADDLIFSSSFEGAMD